MSDPHEWQWWVSGFVTGVLVALVVCLTIHP